MDLVLISPEGEDPREAALLPELMAAGLRRYHLRKPGWSAERMSRWLSDLPAEIRCRIVPHQHHNLVERFGLAGRHWPDREEGPPGRAPGARAGSAPRKGADAGLGAPDVASGSGSCGLRSRSCHGVTDLERALGAFDSVFFGPVFPSISKPGRDPDSSVDAAALAHLLGREDADRRRTPILALGGVTAERVLRCRVRGFDGVAVLGAVWGAADPLGAFRSLDALCRSESSRNPVPGEEAESRGDRADRVIGGSAVVRGPAAEPALWSCGTEPAMGRWPKSRAADRLHWLMCLTLDGIGLSHEEQARRLCAAGARWVQIRMKEAGEAERRCAARACADICREHGALCVINDRLDVALDAAADGAHLGGEDGDWIEARRTLGPGGILGGTVNDERDAARAVSAGCLDYAGVGPLRFTSSKRKLSPVLGVPGIARLVRALGSIPAWAIGGVGAEDIPGLRSAGAAGIAVSSALYRNGDIAGNLAAFLRIGDAARGRLWGPGGALAAGGRASDSRPPVGSLGERS
ncbi:MAG: thiamine phosphate synthase [Opitutaceae bacterium]